MDVFLIKDDDLLNKYNFIWDNVSTDIKKWFDKGPVYNKDILKTKIKSYSDDATDFLIKKFPKWTLIILV